MREGAQAEGAHPRGFVRYRIVPEVSRLSRGKFVKVKCDGCGNEQIVFSRPSRDVECVVCGDVLAESSGGTAEFQSQVVGEV
ncbi:MAG: 30S ribosomal protein S27e, partial [Candidatus Nanohaloarchaea archaeon]